MVCVYYSVHMCVCSVFFFFKQKTAYEMRISDWSSDVCSSDLSWALHGVDLGHVDLALTDDLSVPDSHIEAVVHNLAVNAAAELDGMQIGRASCRESVCQYV